MRKIRGSKWEPNWVRHYSRSQTDKVEVLDNRCHMIFASIAFALNVMLLQLLPFLDASFAKYKSCLLKKNLKQRLGEKPPNLMRETEEKNQKTNKNILACKIADESQIRIMLFVKNFLTQ